MSDFPEPLFGNKPPRDWRKHSPIPTEADEAKDSEDATPEDRAFAIANTGVDLYPPKDEAGDSKA